MSTKTSSKYCRRCGCEYESWINECVDCEEELVDYVPSFVTRELNEKKRKSPSTASLLSLICFPGFGQFYVGKTPKGVGFLAANLVVIFIEIGNFWVTATIALRVWSAVDAYRDAKDLNKENDV